MAGRLRLAATGAQDQWLTGEPQFSYFLMYFKRHTKFALDVIESQFDGNIGFGEVLISRIPNDRGDLIRNFTLKIDLTNPFPDANVWSPSVITHLIEHAELFIGGQSIEKITGEYIYMHQQLHNTNDDINQTLYFLNGHGGRILSYTGTYTYFIDLPFYFYRNPTLAIPTCALTKQYVEVRVKTRNLDELILFGAPPDVSATIKRFSIDTEFVYVTPDERNFLMTGPIDYVITQVQVSSFKMKAGTNRKSVMLNFTHPVRELFFVSQSEQAVRENKPSVFNIIKNAELKFNNETVFNEPETFLVYEQALRHYVNAPSALQSLGSNFQDPAFSFGPSKFGMFSFAIRPMVHYPTGQVNMSRIIHKLFTIEIEPQNDVDDNNTRVYAVNYNVLRIQSGLAGLKF
jgi:hypothetical protein